MSRDIGTYFRQVREHIGISLEQAAYETKIERIYLSAIEKGRLDQLPGPIYIRSYIRTYAMYLGIDPKPILRQIQITEPTSMPQTTRPMQIDSNATIPPQMVEEQPTASMNWRGRRTIQEEQAMVNQGATMTIDRPRSAREDASTVEEGLRQVQDQTLSRRKQPMKKKKKKSWFTGFLVFCTILLLFAALYVGYLRYTT